MNSQIPAKIETFFLTVADRKLEVERVGGENDRKPTLVLLHEGLGSISLWQDFPSKLANRTGCPVVVYSRYGYGRSEVLSAARNPDYMHYEALTVLPELLDKLGVREPILIGHSDGGSIALIYAGAYDHLAGLILLAPHVFVEEISIASIAEAKIAFETSDLPSKLGRHHKDAERTFRGWNDIWLHPDFRQWNIEDYLPRIACPILAIQGFDDEYGTMAQLDAIAGKAAGPVEVLRLANCRHSPHRDQPDQVLNVIKKFVEKLDGAVSI